MAATGFGEVKNPELAVWGDTQRMTLIGKGVTAIWVKWLDGWQTPKERPKCDFATAGSPAVRNLWLSWDQLNLHKGVYHIRSGSCSCSAISHEAGGAQNIAEVGVEYVPWHNSWRTLGGEEDIPSNQAHNYEASLIQQICTLLEVCKLRSSPFQPSANGVIERVNDVLTSTIAAFVDMDQKAWNVHLPLLTVAHQCCVHESIGLLPKSHDGRMQSEFAPWSGSGY